MDRPSTLVFLNTAHRPSAYDLIYDAPMIQKPLALAQGEFVSVSQREHVGNIGTGHRTLRLRVVVILEERSREDGILRSCSEALIAIHIADRLRVSIRQQEREPLRVAFLQTGLQSVIGDAANRIFRMVDTAILREWTDGRSEEHTSELQSQSNLV